VQKFHPTVIRWASPLLISSSLSSIAPSKATTMLSFSFVIVSTQAARSLVPVAGRLICTHLDALLSARAGFAYRLLTGPSWQY
jgi:hypothetical protein